MCKPGKERSPETNAAGPGSMMSSLQQHEKINIYCLSHPAGGIL